MEFDSQNCASWMDHLSLLLHTGVTILRGNNLPLTWFRHFWQLVGRNYSYLLPGQDGGTSQKSIGGFTTQNGQPANCRF